MPQRRFTAVVERCPETGLYVGFVPGFPGAHSQGETLDELNRNLREVIELLLEEGEPTMASGRPWHDGPSAQGARPFTDSPAQDRKGHRHDG